MKNKTVFVACDTSNLNKIKNNKLNKNKKTKNYPKICLRFYSKKAEISLKILKVTFG